MGKNNVNKRFTVDLEISTGDAEKQVKASAENIKKILSSAIEDGIGTKELRKMAETINAMFTGLGKTAPLNIDENFTGKGKTAERVKILSNELNNLFDILGKINTTSSTSGNVLGGVNNEAQAEIDKLEEQSRRYQSIIDTFNQVSKMKIAWDDGDKIELDIEATEESAKKLIDRFNQLNDVINEGNLDDITYADALANRAKAALQLIEINERLTKTNKNGEVIKESPKFLRDFLAMNDDGESLSQYALEDFEYEAPEIISKLKNSVSEVTRQMENLRNTTETALSGVDSTAKGSSIGNKVDDIGKAAESSKEKVDALKNSIKEVFMSSAQIEVDTRSGKLNGNETMSLFEANGNVSTVQGTDYQVDTDVLVQQAIANLNKNIVMSLHNHANGDMTFSPSDINSFAKLYYGQGTKINGIIANGVIQTIDFNNISQEVAVKIAQDYQEGVKHFFDSELVSQFASLQSGEIIPTDMLKRLQINDPKQYQEVINTIQEGTMATLRQAFENNGAEFALQSFDVDNIEKLTEYLHKAQQSAQGTIEPVEKLKNLITTLNPNKTFDWNQFTDIFEKFKSGAIDGTQAFNQILDFKTVAADVGIVTTSINQAESKLQEFLALADEIHSKSFSDAFDATDNVEIGKYAERLNSAKAALDELGDQGQFTAEQLEQINSAFDVATRDLQAKTHTYDGYTSGYSSAYDYYDEYQDELEKKESLQAENEQLRAQLADQEANRQEGALHTNSSVVGDMSQESKRLDELHAKLIAVKEAVDAKTQAFEEEYVTADAAVNAEVQALQLLLQQLQDVLNTIGLINQAFIQANESIARLYGAKDINIKEDVTSNAAIEKSKEIIDKQYALDSTVASTNKILGDILAAINKEKDPGVQENLGTLISALTANINALKDATSGVIDHQKAQKTNLSTASSRIANNYDELVSQANVATTKLGSDMRIKQMKPLADGIVEIEGAVKNADGVWNGFIANINESNQTILTAVGTQLSYARSLNKSADAAKENSNAVQQQDTFTGKLAIQKTDFAQYKQEVENATGVTDELKGKLVELENQLNSVGDADGLAKWVQSFKNVANEIKSSRGKIATEIIGKANSKFREVDFKADSNNLTSEQQAIVDKRDELLKQIDEYNAKVSSSQKAEISGIEATRDALYNLIDAYKKKYNIENAGGSATKKAYGTAQLQNFTGKYNDLIKRAGNVELNSDFEAVQKLTAAYQHLKDVQAKFKVGEDTKSGVGAQKAEEFKQAQIECNRYAQELAKIITAEEKLRTNSNSTGGKSAPVAEDFDDSMKGRAQALEDFVRVAYGASASIGKLNDDMTELSFVVKNSDGTVTNMTASLNAARTAIYATAGGTEKATTSFGRFFDELKAKARGITTYLISMTGFQEIWQQIRQGVQYVREIDSALTELKKVTDETAVAYDNFAKSAYESSKRIGSTMKEFIQASADFARLGYSLEEASQLAEAANVYKNVGDSINDVAQASESIISTMKAFNIEATDSMEIVDRFNEIGNNFAIDSVGIGEALKRSASALAEAGNSIDESIALVTGANSVVQNPEQVGEMLADIA